MLVVMLYLQNTSSRPPKKQQNILKQHIASPKIDDKNHLPKFNPFKDVKVDHIVAINSGTSDKELEISIYLQKVSTMKNVISSSG